MRRSTIWGSLMATATVVAMVSNATPSGAASPPSVSAFSEGRLSTCQLEQRLDRTTFGVRVRVCSTSASTIQPASVGRQGAAADPSQCAIPTVDDRCEAWVSAPFNGKANGVDIPGDGGFNSRIADISPDGSTMYVAASVDNGTAGGPTDYDATLLAFDTSDGALRWSAAYPGPTAANAYAMSLTVTRSRIFMGGSLDGGFSFGAAFNPTSGATVWTATLPTSYGDSTASPDGSRFFLASTRGVGLKNGSYRIDAVVFALNGHSGRTRWQRSIHGGSEADPLLGWRIAASGDGAKVVMAAGIAHQDPGQPDDGFTTKLEVGTFDAATGQRLSLEQHPTYGFPEAGVVISPDGGTAYVEQGTVPAPTNKNQLLTIAVDLGTGSDRWAVYYGGPVDGQSDVRATDFAPLQVSPDGTAVFVGGSSSTSVGSGMVAVSYDAVTGAQRWTHSEEAGLGSCLGCGPTLSMNPNGTEVTMTGVDPFVLFGGYANETVSLATADGTARWHAVYAGPPGRQTFAGGIVHSHDGARVYIGGYTVPAGSTTPDVFAAAYDTA
jgi:hypothetical protein